ncbi:MAG: hypothetical protein BWY90_00112 [Deltaproteobacteria bacterium ADurb.BinA014]|nr:MAG: hypothetical protein BWY90_00112 [Deltaproteobacteria bacterium ADurb.BinA014]
MDRAKELMDNATQGRADILDQIEQNQDFIINLFEHNGFHTAEILDNDERPLKAYDAPPYMDNLSYCENAPGSGKFEFHYFMPNVCPDTPIHDLSDAHFWNAAEIIAHTLEALKEKLFEAEARRGSIVIKFSEILPYKPTAEKSAQEAK